VNRIGANGVDGLLERPFEFDNLVAESRFVERLEGFLDKRLGGLF